MQKTITVQIFPDGSSDIDLVGFNGNGCQKVVDDLRGNDSLISEQRKREFTATQTNLQKQVLGGSR